MITKKFVEELLGIEINDFKIKSTESGIINIYVTPKMGLQYIEVNITISSEGVKFNE